MTSDAKIGLLLGLVFIFIIAFIINGLPSLNRDGNSNELTTNMVNSHNNAGGIGAKERRVITQIRPVVRKVAQEPQGETLQKKVEGGTGVERTAAVDNDLRTRFTGQLPEVTQGANAAPGAGESSIVVKAASVVEATKSPEAKKNTAGFARYYVVSEGDNLSSIAKKFYGSKEGNRQVNIDRIFAANRKVLRSCNEIRVGQKLLIPPLTQAAKNSGRLEKVYARGESAEMNAVVKKSLPVVGQGAKKGKVCVVNEGDSLWSIAAERLSNGSRYGEIAKLNSDILGDKDRLVVGMRLKMPAK